MSAVDVEQLQPISRTYQYRKVMKPLLERKRRARINRCLDELKEFILSTLQAEGENVSKLEKADILEFTVQHLHKLRRHNRLNGNDSNNSSSSSVVENGRFGASFTHCANEGSRCPASTPGIDLRLDTKLMSHPGYRLTEMEKTAPLSVRIAENYSPAPPSSPSSISSTESGYNMPLTPNSSFSSCSRTSSPCHPETTQFSGNGLLAVMNMSTMCAPTLWRPW